LKICGKEGNAQCTSDDVVITSVSRRRSGAKVEFYVKTTSAANAKAGATALNTALTKNGGADFVTQLKADAKKLGATELEKVTGVTVTKAPAAGTQTITKPAASSKTAVAAASVTAGVSLASLAFAALALQ
jgi:phage-related protein